MSVTFINKISCRTWTSSPKVGQISLVNPVICGAILFNGGMPTKTLRMFTSIGVAMPSYATYKKYQKDYLFGVSTIKKYLCTLCNYNAIVCNMPKSVTACYKLSVGTFCCPDSTWLLWCTRETAPRSIIGKWRNEFGRWWEMWQPWTLGFLWLVFTLWLRF